MNKLTKLNNKTYFYDARKNGKSEIGIFFRVVNDFSGNINFNFYVHLTDKSLIRKSKISNFLNDSSFLAPDDDLIIYYTKDDYIFCESFENMYKKRNKELTLKFTSAISTSIIDNLDFFKEYIVPHKYKISEILGCDDIVELAKNFR